MVSQRVASRLVAQDRPLHPLARGNRPRKMREDLPSARCLRQSSPKQKRRRVVGKQPPPEVWKEITFPMQITQGHCLIHALELACEFLGERKWCRELSKESSEVFDTRTRVVLWNKDAARLRVEDFLQALFEEVPDSLKLLEDQEVTGGRWRRHTTTYEFELSVARGHRVWLRKLLIFLGSILSYLAKVTTKWACQSRFSDSYVRLVV